MGKEETQEPAETGGPEDSTSGEESVAGFLGDAKKKKKERKTGKKDSKKKKKDSKKKKSKKDKKKKKNPLLPLAARPALPTPRRQFSG